MVKKRTKKTIGERTAAILKRKSKVKKTLSLTKFGRVFKVGK